MDTIIYVYLRKKHIEHSVEGSGCIKTYRDGVDYYRRDFDMGSYRLVSVGVSEELWRILQEREPVEPETDGGKSRCSAVKQEEKKGTAGGRKICPPWIRLQRQRQLRNAKQRRQQRLLEEVEIRRQFLQELLEEPDYSCFVTEEPVPFLEGWSFRGYLEEDWVLHMMQYAGLNHFVILGKAPCLPGLLLRYVHKMKSLKWVLPKRQFGEAEGELVEELYEEYGLAVELRLLEEDADYRKLRHLCKLPVTVIDFCEEERVSAADVVKGSIWLDMTASEIKRRRLEERNTQIAYFSLKKEWKQPQKALNYLDTISKNGYNT